VLALVIVANERKKTSNKEKGKREMLRKRDTSRVKTTRVFLATP
jgi:hypothetical protein